MSTAAIPSGMLPAIRARFVLVILLLALAAGAWWTTVVRMVGMDAGPGTGLGTLGWFLGVWVVMMAAMMLPALAPTVALYSRMTHERGLLRPILFAGGYVVVWGGSGLLAYDLFRLGRGALGETFAWHSGGRLLAAGLLAAAAAYELTPAKRACLRRCRTPAWFLGSTWREGPTGALELGSRTALWCMGCCWALMVGLFALGVMSLTWMALVAALITVEKLLPWRRVATWGTAAVLLALAIGILSAPHSVPGLVVPHAIGAMHSMGMMR